MFDTIRIYICTLIISRRKKILSDIVNLSIYIDGIKEKEVVLHQIILSSYFLILLEYMHGGGTCNT